MKEKIKAMDWKLLARQKLWLLNSKDPYADGLVSLVDAVQDYAVDELGVPEKEVFPLITEGEAKAAKDNDYIARVFDAVKLAVIITSYFHRQCLPCCPVDSNDELVHQAEEDYRKNPAVNFEVSLLTKITIDYLTNKKEGKEV